MAALGKSKAGELKDVCRNANFYTDGYFDFNTKLWKSGGKIIDDWRWYIREPRNNEFHVYPILLDRFAYVKINISSVARHIGIKNGTEIKRLSKNLGKPKINLIIYQSNKKTETMKFFSANSCTFFLDTDRNVCPFGNFICGDRDGNNFSFEMGKLKYEEAILFCQKKNLSLCG